MAAVAWTVMINLRTVGGFTRGFNQAGGAAQTLEGRINRVNAAAERFKTVGLAGLVAGGLAAGDALLSGAKGAMAFQNAMLNTSVSTANMGRTLTQTMNNMRPFSDLALNISLKTAQNLSTSMAMIAAGSKVFKTPQQLQAAMTTGGLALYADAQFLQNHTDPTQAIATVSQISHQFGAYTPQAAHAIAEAWWRASNSAPDSAERMATQMPYFSEIAYRMGVSPLATMNLGVLGDVSIGHGKWGAGFGRMLLDLADPTKQKAAGQIALGLRNSRGALTSNVLDANGALDPMKMMTFLSHEFAGMSGVQVMSALGGAFNTTAARVMAMATNPKNLVYMARTLGIENKMPTFEQAQEQYMGTLNGQLALFTSNLQTLNTEVFMPMLPPLTKFVGDLAQLAGGYAKYMAQHPAVAKAAALGEMGMVALGGLAALRLGGGYLAHALPWVFHRGAFRASVGTIATGFTKSGGIRGIAGAAGRGGLDLITGRAALRTIAGSKSFGFLKAIIPAIRDVGYVFEQLGAKALVSKVGLGLLWDVIKGLGLRAIPVVGEVMMVVQVLQFLGKHSFSVGYLLGEAAHLIVNGLSDLLKGIVGWFGSLAHFIMGGPKVWISGIGSFFGGIGTDLVNLGKGAVAGYNHVGAPTPGATKPSGKHVAHLATGGFTRGDGLAYLHKNEVILSAPLTKRLDVMTRSASRGGSSSGRAPNINITVNVQGNADKRTANKIASKVAEILAKMQRLSASSVIAGASFSPYELAGGMS